MKRKYVIVPGILMIIVLSVVLYKVFVSMNDYTEEYRPQFHFSPEENWMNDPNGMVYYKGEYHMFYQYNPYDTKWGPMHWGHAISKDMVNWKHMPLAMEPDEIGMIFSGSAVVDWEDTTGFFDGGEGLVAIFTHALGNEQQQSIAYSKDKGRTWEKYEGNPVIPSDPEIRDFRDPKVFWHDETERWVMLVTAGKKVVFYHSDDLKDWNRISEFGEGMGAQDGVWECADLFELSIDGDESNKKWVMQVDVGDGAIAGGSGAQYFIGDFDGEKFVTNQAAGETNWVDFGADFYAAQSFSDLPEEDGRRVMVSWMSNWLYANEVPTEGWRGSASFPREMALKTSKNNEVKLFQQPIHELDSIRKKAIYRIEDETIDESKASDLLAGIEADTFELTAEIEWDQLVDFGFVIRQSEDGQDGTVIGISHESRELFVERSQREDDYFSPYFNGRHAASMNDDQTIKLQILVDQSSVEVFAQDGEYVITDLIYPKNDSEGIEFYVSDGEVKIQSLEIHSLQSIW